MSFKVFLPSRAEQNQLQLNNIVPVLQLCAYDQQLPTGFHNQPNLSVSSAISQLALLTCTKQLQWKLTRTFGVVPLNQGTINLNCMVAIEAKYHCNCLRELYNKIRPAALKDDDEDRLHGVTFAELVIVIEDMHAAEDNQHLNSQTWLTSTRRDWSSWMPR